MKQSRGKSRTWWVLTLAAGLFMLMLIVPRGPGVPEIGISQVIQMAQDGEIETIEVTGDKLSIITSDDRLFESRKEAGASILDTLESNGVSTGPGAVQVEVNKDGGGVFPILLSFLPMILIVGLVIFMMRRGQGGMGRIMNIGKSKARDVTDNRPAVSFNDVAGADEAKQELAEVVEFLRSPDKFTKLGAKIPKGVLLVGPPGTGKTLISRAVAGEADVRFFSTSGSDFVEMFVGVGASRVRDLFSCARQAAPAVIFIDEIDAVGRHRGAGIGGGHDEREQTLNQILIEMDGFDERSNVIVIAATNRPDILDPALIRPGRFDRRVMLDLPDVRGREAILDVHVKGKSVQEGLDLNAIARETHGFSGADLANLTNEAAILAAREGKDEITASEFDEAIDRLVAGPARKSRKVSARERNIVAFHEAGHALVASQLPEADPVRKVTIVPRGGSGGHTRLVPDEERQLWSKGQFEAMLAVMMGGQAAEEAVFGEVTTGASSDLQTATTLARKMVTEYGMSEELGPQTFEDPQAEVFLGKELGRGHQYSDSVAQKIDSEVGSILRRARKAADKVVEDQRIRLSRLVEGLLAEETLQGTALQDLLAGDQGNAALAA